MTAIYLVTFVMFAVLICKWTVDTKPRWWRWRWYRIWTWRKNMGI